MRIRAALTLFRETRRHVEHVRHVVELIVRGAVVYWFLLILLRLTGKRQVGQRAPFDLVLLLVLSNAVQNSMNAGDNSLVGGLISAATLVGVNFLVGLATYKNKKGSMAESVGA